MSDSERSRSGSLDRWALAGLGLAMAIASALILWAGRGTSFTSDELLYYGRLVERSDEFTTFGSANLEYFLAPFSGHLQAVGKLVYEALFATVGTDYVVFRVVALSGLLLCVGLVFVLVRRRVGALPALAAAVLLLFLGAAWEVMLWPFDLHTILAFAAGLGALLALERGGRHADLVACALLVVSVATIEVGLAMSVGVAALVLSGTDRLRRAWIFGVPIVLYVAWWLWARQFEQGDFSASELPSAPISIGESLSATLGSLVGRIDAGSGVFPQTVGIYGWGIALAVLTVAALALRVRRAGLSAWLGGLVAALLAYWVMIATAPDRPPDSSRYIFVGAALLILVGAEAARGARFSRVALSAIAVVVAVALPLNITKLFDGRLYQVSDAEAYRAHYAMVELAARAGQAPTERIGRSGRDVFFALQPASYLEAVPRLGSIAFSLDQLRGQDDRARSVADQTLAELYELELEPAPAPADQGACRVIESESGAIAFDLTGESALLRAERPDGVALGLGRFSNEIPSVSIGKLAEGEWQRLAIPPDSAAERWRVFADGGVQACEP